VPRAALPRATGPCSTIRVVEAGSEERPPRRGLGARLAGALGRRAPQRSPEPKGSEPAAETEWLDAAVEEFERRLADVLRKAGEDLHAQVERDLAATEERLSETERRLQENVSARLEGAVAEVRVQGDAQLADEIERVHEAANAPLAEIKKAESEIQSAAEKLGMRARRQELKLVREENSKRITAALARLEREAEARTAEMDRIRQEASAVLAEVDERTAAVASATAELGQRLEHLAEPLAEAERRADSTAGLVAEAVGRLEGAVGRAQEAEQRMGEISDRVGETARRITELAESAGRAADWERRLAAAVHAEADVARRITEAERRLLERVDPTGD
jgi:chromosome segregation ATPase